jgi:hypothetical protein
MRVPGTQGLCSHTVRVFGDDIAPETTATIVSLGHPDDPTYSKPIPEQKGRLTAHSRATIAPNYKELGDVEVLWILGSG